MPRPRYSIVVPTRHRPHTLPHTLATLLCQDHGSYEIVVADNASGPETRRVVEDFADGRIHYLRSDNPLSMAANWQRALAACRGEWIMYLGDDDGLMPNALNESDTVIAAHSVRSIRQQYAVYIWPCADSTGEANRLQLHLGRSVHVANASDALAAMTARPNAAPIALPYHGWIHRSLYEEAATSGPVFQGTDPDTYAGILLAAHTDTFVSQDRPLSLVGISGTSNTYRFVVTGQSGDSTRDSDRLNAAEGLVRHPCVPDVPTVTAALIDGLLKVRDRLGAGAIAWQPTSLEIALHCAASVWRTDAEGDRQLRRVRGLLHEDADVAAFDAAVAARPASGRPPRMTCVDRGRQGSYLVLDTQVAGVRNVAEASTAAAAALETTSLVEVHHGTTTPAEPSLGLLKQFARTMKRTLRSWWPYPHRSA